jgi:hypothetical protein
MGLVSDIMLKGATTSRRFTGTDVAALILRFVQLTRKEFRHWLPIPFGRLTMAVLVHALTEPLYEFGQLLGCFKVRML